MSAARSMSTSLFWKTLARRNSILTASTKSCFVPSGTGAMAGNFDTATNKPSPMTAFDAFFHMALIVTLRGTQEVIEYYTALLATMKDRVARGIGAVPNEKYRLLWDNIPIWHRMKWLSKKFASHNACLVADTYTSAWCSTSKYINLEKPIDSMAEVYTRIYLNIGVDEMAKMVIEMIDKYDVDGVVLHSNRSCKPYSFGQLDIQKIVRRKEVYHV